VSHALDELAFAEVDVGDSAARSLGDFERVGLGEALEVIVELGDGGGRNVDLVELDLFDSV
jgi:hypothetical protein